MISMHHLHHLYLPQPKMLLVYFQKGKKKSDAKVRNSVQNKTKYQLKMLFKLIASYLFLRGKTTPQRLNTV